MIKGTRNQPDVVKLGRGGPLPGDGPVTPDPGHLGIETGVIPGAGTLSGRPGGGGGTGGGGTGGGGTGGGGTGGGGTGGGGTGGGGTGGGGTGGGTGQAS